MRSACAVLALLSTAHLLRADDGLSADVLRALKGATVFVKVQAGKLSGSGSGFVLKTEGDTTYLVTNHHVVRPTVVVQRGTGPLANRILKDIGTADSVPALKAAAAGLDRNLAQAVERTANEAIVAIAAR